MEDHKKIYKIEEFDVVDETVYDIELEKNHYFAANGIITHNCRLKNKIQTKEFNFTNGNIGIMTGSKSVITLNLNRIVQECDRNYGLKRNGGYSENNAFLKDYLCSILSRVYKYHEAYNELLWDMYDANLLPVYTAGFIDLNKQYLTIGLNGLNQAAEYLGIKCNDNEQYKKLCNDIFGWVKEQNTLHNTTKGHKLTFNTELVPAESLAAKNYNWDKEDGYWVPDDVNLYASYIYKPNDPNVSVLEKIRLHGREYIGDWLDGGSALHANLDSHLSVEQYRKLITYAAEVGCNYLTWNIPESICPVCGYIEKRPLDKCPKCGNTHLDYATRVIGYLTIVKNWADPRKKEFEDRVFAHVDEDKINNINDGGYIGFNKYKAR